MKWIKDFFQNINQFQLYTIFLFALLISLLSWKLYQDDKTFKSDLQAVMNQDFSVQGCGDVFPYEFEGEYDESEEMKKRLEMHMLCEADCVGRCVDDPIDMEPGYAQVTCDCTGNNQRCEELGQYVGSGCDDGDDTNNPDTIRSDCECRGTPIPVCTEKIYYDHGDKELCISECAAMGGTCYDVEEDYYSGSNRPRLRCHCGDEDFCGVMDFEHANDELGAFNLCGGNVVDLEDGGRGCVCDENNFCMETGYGVYFDHYSQPPPNYPLHCYQYCTNDGRGVCVESSTNERDFDNGGETMECKCDVCGHKFSEFEDRSGLITDRANRSCRELCEKPGKGVCQPFEDSSSDGIDYRCSCQLEDSCGLIFDHGYQCEAACSGEGGTCERVNANNIADWLILNPLTAPIGWVAQLFSDKDDRGCSCNDSGPVIVGNCTDNVLNNGEEFTDCGGLNCDACICDEVISPNDTSFRCSSAQDCPLSSVCVNLVGTCESLDSTSGCPAGQVSQFECENSPEESCVWSVTGDSGHCACDAPDQCDGELCLDYCRNGIRYYDGECVNISGECLYQQELCPNGCDGNACAGVISGFMCNLSNGICDLECPDINTVGCYGAKQILSCNSDCSQPVSCEATHIVTSGGSVEITCDFEPDVSGADVVIYQDVNQSSVQYGTYNYTAPTSVSLPSGNYVAHCNYEGKNICNTRISIDAVACSSDQDCGETVNQCTAYECINPNTTSSECVIINLGTNVSCDDNLFCNGSEYCDGSGSCSSTGGPCANNETCTEVNGCEPTGQCVDSNRCNSNLNKTGPLYCDGLEIVYELREYSCNSNNECEKINLRVRTDSTCDDGNECTEDVCNSPGTQGGGPTCSNTGSCTTYQWKTGSYGGCSASCGQGTKERNVYCEDSNGNGVSDSFCDPGTKPATQESCTGNNCGCTPDISCEDLVSATCSPNPASNSCGPCGIGTKDCGGGTPGGTPGGSPGGTVVIGYFWQEGEWGACSVECGGGRQHRVALCKQITTDAVGGSRSVKTVSDSSCESNGHPKPSLSQECNTQACQPGNTYSRSTADRSICSTACGGGTQSRAVTCVDQTGAIAQASMCTQTMPPASQVCNTQACLGDECGYELVSFETQNAQCSENDQSILSQLNEICQNKGMQYADKNITLQCGGSQTDPTLGTSPRLSTTDGLTQSGEYQKCSYYCGSNSCCIDLCVQKIGIISDDVLAADPCPGLCNYEPGCTRDCLNCGDAIGGVTGDGVIRVSGTVTCCETQNTYSRRTSDWEDCSTTCGGGVQNRKSACIDQSGTIVSDALCVEPIPVLQQSCNTQACATYRRKAGDWSTCTQACGGGTQSRTATCLDANDVIVTDDNCVSGMPVLERACNSEPCIETCSDTCTGKGVLASNASWVNATQDSCEQCRWICDEGFVETEGVCIPLPTYDRIQAPFGSCSKECGGGTRDAGWICKNDLGETVIDSLCDTTQPDIITQQCNTQICAVCESGTTRTCGDTNEGACSRGTEICLDGQRSGECEGNIGPSHEICDSIDNNCNGEIDEGKVCDVCEDGEEKVCGSNLGQCKKGVRTCVEGQWSRSCAGNIGPQDEVCDGADNNCNGAIDENLQCGGGGGGSSGGNNYCGDGKLSLNRGEECDDGNYTDGDGCSRNCKIEGNIIVPINPSPILNPTPAQTIEKSLKEALKKLRMSCRYMDVEYHDIRFRDVKRSDMGDPADILRTYCIVKGYDKTNRDRFHNDAATGVGEYIKVLTKIYAMEHDIHFDEYTVYNGDISYFDVSVNKRYAPYIGYAERQGLLEDVGGGMGRLKILKPASPITKDDAEKMLRNAGIEDDYRFMMGFGRYLKRKDMAALMVTAFGETFADYKYVFGNNIDTYAGLLQQLKGKTDQEQRDYIKGFILELDKLDKEEMGRKYLMHVDGAIEFLGRILRGDFEIEDEEVKSSTQLDNEYNFLRDIFNLD